MLILNAKPDILMFGIPDKTNKPPTIATTT